MSAAPTTPPDDASLAGSLVFRKAPPRAWAVSFLAHAGAFALLATVGAYIGVRTGVIPPSIVEFDVPPRTRTPPPPPPRPAAPAPPSHAPQPSTRPAAAHRPSSHPGRTGRSAAPHVMAAQGNGGGAGGDEMPVGDNNDFRGGTVGNGDGPAPAPVVTPAPVIAPTPTPSRRSEPAEVAEESLAVRAVIDCDDAALAGLYPQAALDNEVEVPTLAVELVIDPDGTLAHARARANPGFGIAAAMERGALQHCRVTTVPRDARGVAVRTRVLKRIRFLFE